MHIRTKVWIEHDGEVLFGEGRLQLLKAVEEHGSLAAAARELGMSYRAAWGRLKASEERLGVELVTRSSKGRRAIKLTDRARRILETFAKLDEDFEHLRRKVQPTTLAALDLPHPIDDLN